jgi:hypothetical protein
MDRDGEGADNRRDELADRPFETPAVSRLAVDNPARSEILVAHEHALVAGDAGYLDPVSGLFVLTATFLADRGYCCERGCRHCPFVVDEVE